MTGNTDRKTRPKVVLVIRALVLNAKNEVLLIQRSHKNEFMPGKWELPGGKLDVGQDISNALEREVLEETGLVVMPTDKVAYWHSEVLSSGKYKGLPYIVLIGTATCVGGDVILSEEHNNFAWVSVQSALKYDLVQETRAALTVLKAKIT